MASGSAPGSTGGEAEGHRPQRSAACPVEQLVGLGDHEALLLELVADGGQDGILVRAGSDRAIGVHHSHSRAPFFHSYTKPMVSTPRNTSIDQNPNRPTSPSDTAQGNRKATSRSKMMNRMATR